MNKWGLLYSTALKIVGMLSMFMPKLTIAYTLEHSGLLWARDVTTLRYSLEQGRLITGWWRTVAQLISRDIVKSGLAGWSSTMGSKRSPCVNR